jgi:hypothetical protein
VLDDEGAVLARAPGFEECLLVVDVDPEEVLARRLSDVRRRALARERGTPDAEVVHVGSPQPSRNGRRVEAVVAEPLDDLEQMRLALELGLRDYVEKNGFREVVVGVSGGDRLGARRRARGGGARPGAGALCVDAVAVLVLGDSG